jgi:colicin import membrane protein
MIQARIQRNWIRPASARPGLRCTVNVQQIPGGEVVGASIASCNGDDAVRQSIVSAVLRSSPLPAPPDPALFERNLVIEFVPEE